MISLGSEFYMFAPKMPKMPKDKTQVISILEQSIALFRRAGMPELASRWERILNTYNIQKGKTVSYSNKPLNPRGNQPDSRLRF